MAIVGDTWQGTRWRIPHDALFQVYLEQSGLNVSKFWATWVTPPVNFLHSCKVRYGRIDTRGNERTVFENPNAYSPLLESLHRLRWKLQNDYVVYWWRIHLGDNFHSQLRDSMNQMSPLFHEAGMTEGTQGGRLVSPRRVETPAMWSPLSPQHLAARRAVAIEEPVEPVDPDAIDRAVDIID